MLLGLGARTPLMTVLVILSLHLVALEKEESALSIELQMRECKGVYQLVSDPHTNPHSILPLSSRISSFLLSSAWWAPP